MNTSQLLVEYIILGSIAEIWVGLLLFAAIPSLQFISQQAVDNLTKASALLAIMLIAFTYVLGGIVNFLADILLASRFQKKYREDIFIKKGLSYRDARGVITQKASSETAGRLQVNNHIMRISRGNVINFLFIVITALINIPKNPSVFIVISLLAFLLAILSFFQWKERYKSHFDQMLRVYEAILKDKKSK